MRLEALRQILIGNFLKRMEKGATTSAVAKLMTLEPEVQVGTCVSTSGFPFKTVLHTVLNYVVPGADD